MAKFTRKGKNRGAAISTASLPDIIFMLLFFFMVTTVMRDVELVVEIDPAKATEVVKLEKKAMVDYIYVGPPVDPSLGTAPRIQLNDAFATLNDIDPFVQAGRAAREEKLQPGIVTALKVDKNVKMGIITDIKEELRKVQALKINYSTVEGSIHDED